jgi:hypothetical protein
MPPVSLDMVKALMLTIWQFAAMVSVAGRTLLQEGTARSVDRTGRLCNRSTQVAGPGFE